MASAQVSLSVNDTPIELDYFVRGFINDTISGMLASLKGTGEIKNLDIAIEGEKVAINLNDDVLPINLFASEIIRSTIAGIISPLKGVSEINKANISIRR